MTTTTTQQDESRQWLKRMLQAARESGATLLDPHWRGWNAKYAFACSHGHTWTRIGTNVIHSGRARCPVCQGMERLSALHQVAQKAGSVCLDTEWRGSDAYYHFRCSQGHDWKRKADKFWGTGANCPHCAYVKSGKKKLRRDGLERLHQAASARGGQCLSDTYAGGYHRYRFRCGEGHEWDAEGNEVLRGAWCLKCSHRQKSKDYLDQHGLERLRQAARERGGECLSNAYAGQALKYRFRCAKGHEWEATGQRILRGAWCLKCAYEGKRLGIEAAHQAAAARGGLCLSTEYRNSVTKLSWQCDRGHAWQAPLGKIRQGHWCPQCAHMAMISNRKSKARMRYGASPRHTVDPTQ